MKLRINGVELEGTLDEILEYVKEKNEHGTVPVMINGKPFGAFVPRKLKGRHRTNREDKIRTGIKHEYMLKKHDWTRQGAKAARYFKVSPTLARQLSQKETPHLEAKDSTLETFTRYFASRGVTVAPHFFMALATVLKENDEVRTRSFIREHMTEQDYLGTFLPFILAYGKRLKEHFELEGNLKITQGGIRLT